MAELRWSGLEIKNDTQLGQVEKLKLQFMMEMQVQLEPRHLLLEVMVNQGIRYLCTFHLEKPVRWSDCCCM